MTSPWKISTHVCFTSEPLANVEYITPYKFNGRGKGHGHGGLMLVSLWTYLQYQINNNKSVTPSTFTASTKTIYDPNKYLDSGSTNYLIANL